MGFLDNLLDKVVEKKHCDVCGCETGRIFGNNKLEDGNMCDECASKLSPFFHSRRHTTLADIKAQLNYREVNAQLLDGFKPDRIVATPNDWKVLLEPAGGRFVVTAQSDWRAGNPDLIPYDQFLGCDVRIDEDKDEIFDRDPEGRQVPFEPRRYKYSYDFYVTVHLSSPYFDTIEFKVNDRDVEELYCDEYNKAEAAMFQVKYALEARKSGQDEKEFEPDHPMHPMPVIPIPIPMPMPESRREPEPRRVEPEPRREDPRFNEPHPQPRQGGYAQPGRPEQPEPRNPMPANGGYPQQGRSGVGGPSRQDGYPQPGRGEAGEAPRQGGRSLRPEGNEGRPGQGGPQGGPRW